VVTRIEYAIKHKDIAIGAFLDIIKQVAENYGVEPAICRWICAMLESRNISATLSGETVGVSEARGYPQGGMLSLLWSLVVDDLFRGSTVMVIIQ
jgi:hypothetical protein